MPYPGASHPRIYLTASEIARLTALKDAGDTRWLALKARCDADLSGSPYNPTGRIPQMGLAYRLTGTTAYADRAIQWM